jgi:hypothetical protein
MGRTLSIDQQMEEVPKRGLEERDERRGDEQI